MLSTAQSSRILIGFLSENTLSCMSTESEALNQMAAKLDSFVMDSSLVDAFCDAFGRQSGKAFNRAIASRVCFLEWLALYSCVGKSADKWQTVALAFYQVLEGFGGLYVKWTVEDFFVDVDEQPLFADPLIAKRAGGQNHQFTGGAVAVRFTDLLRDIEKQLRL